MLGFFPHNLSNSFSEAVCKAGTWVYCSVAQSCLILCNPMDCSTPGFPVLHYLPELPQTSCPLWCYPNTDTHTHTHTSICIYTCARTHTHTWMEQIPPSDLISLWRLESMRFQKSTNLSGTSDSTRPFYWGPELEKLKSKGSLLLGEFVISLVLSRHNKNLKPRTSVTALCYSSVVFRK